MPYVAFTELRLLHYMMILFFMVDTVLIASCSSSHVLGATISDVELNALKERQRLESGEIILDVKGQRNGQTVVRRSVRCFFDSEKLRNDASYRVEDRSNSQRRDYTEITCYANGKHIWYNDGVPSVGKRYPVRVSEKPTQSDRQAFPAIDVRLLGLVPIQSLALYNARMDTVLARPDRKESSTNDVALNDVKCKRVEYSRNDGVVVHIWIAPEMDYSVLRIEVKSEDGKTTEVVENTQGKDHKSGLWFPQLCHFQRIVNNNVVVDDLAKVTVVGLNKRLPAEAFDIAGMNIAPGTPVVTIPSPAGPVGELTWDGTKIVAAHPEYQHPLNPLTLSETNLARRWTLIICSVLLALLSAVFFWRRWRKLKHA